MARAARFTPGFNGWAHQLGLAQQVHQAQGRDRAEVHLLSSL